MEEIEIQTLTPLWTGDVQRNSIRIKETSIVGSLRWWHEAIMRKLGGNPCDPTTPSCTFDYERYKINADIQDGLRPVCGTCRLFGCTGFSRRFRLGIDGLQEIPLFFVSHQNVYLSNGNWLKRIFEGEKVGKGKGTLFSFNKGMLFDPNPFLVKVKSLYNDHDVHSAIYFLLWFISEYGGLGAKTQNGFGQITIRELNRRLLERGKKYVTEHVTFEEREENRAMFDLNNFFSVEFEIEDKDPYYSVGKEIGNPSGLDYRRYFIPCAFDIRYKMRSRNPFTREGENWGMRPFFLENLGTKREARQKTKALLGGTDGMSSRIFVSHLFKKDPDQRFHIRVWGFVPDWIEEKEKIKDLVTRYICDRRTFYGARLKKEYKEKEVFS